uniref:Uncharacterized protein n=1 Tax=Mycena chlorophos TaxID=658473 RepID=A0ABQ0LP27_MYCCL|nr:predicted protein [Mycena chlorophos]
MAPFSACIPLQDSTASGERQHYAFPPSHAAAARPAIWPTPSHRIRSPVLRLLAHTLHPPANVVPRIRCRHSRSARWRAAACRYLRASSQTSPRHRPQARLRCYCAPQWERLPWTAPRLQSLVLSDERYTTSRQNGPGQHHVCRPTETQACAAAQARLRRHSALRYRPLPPKFGLSGAARGDGPKRRRLRHPAVDEGSLLVLYPNFTPFKLSVPVQLRFGLPRLFFSMLLASPEHVWPRFGSTQSLPTCLLILPSEPCTILPSYLD